MTSFAFAVAQTAQLFASQIETPVARSGKPTLVPVLVAPLLVAWFSQVPVTQVASQVERRFGALVEILLTQESNQVAPAVAVAPYPASKGT